MKNRPIQSVRRIKPTGSLPLIWYLAGAALFLPLLTKGNPEEPDPPIDLPGLAVIAERPHARESMPVEMRAWNPRDIAREIPRTIDEMLLQEPGFSLFRRQTGLFAHPTTQGGQLA